MAIARIRPQGLIAPDDVPAHEVPPEFWTAANNMSFRDIYAEQVRGWASIYDAASTIGLPLHVLNNFFNGINYWLYGFDNGIGVTDAAGNHTDLTPGAGAPSSSTSDQWSSCELNGIPVMNWRDVTGPHSWDKNLSNNMAPPAAWLTGYACDVIRSHKNYLIALALSGTNEWPSVAAWSDSAAPGNLPTTWVPGAGNDAGSLSFGDTGAKLVDGLTLRDQFMVYKTHATYILQYIGGTLIFGQRNFLETTGCLASNCVAEWGGNHVVMADGDVLITDGNQVRSLIDKATRRTLFSDLDPTNYLNSYVVANKNQNEVWVCYVQNGQTYPTKALVWDASSGSTRFKDTVDIFGATSFRDLLIGGSGCPHIAHGNVSISLTADTWTTVTGAWSGASYSWESLQLEEALDGLIGIDADSENLVQVDFGNSYESGTLYSTVKRESLDLGDAETIKLVRRIWPRIIGTNGQQVQIRIGSQMEPDTNISWSAFQNYTIGSQQHWLDMFTRGRYISVQIQATDIDPYRVTGVDFDVVPDGEF